MPRIQLGVIDLPNVADVSLAAYAEELGFDSFYVGDNPMMWSDPFVTLALAAQQTQRIRLGPSVAVTGVRPVPSLAQSMASLNLLAPGRVACAVGTGNSAMRVLGHKPMLQRHYEDYVSALKPLLAGEEATLRWNGRETIVGHVMELERGFFRFDPAVPLWISAFGPTSMGIAGRHGDGVVGYMGGSPAEIDAAWKLIEDGAATIGRTIDRATFWVCLMTLIVVLRPGEDVSSPRVLHEAGPVAMVTYHYLYEQYRLFGTPPPPFMAEFWDEWVAQMEREPPDRLHLRIHRGHQNWVPAGDERYVTPELIEGVGVVGTPEEVAAHLRMLGECGIDEVVVTPTPETAREHLADLAEQVMPLL